MLKEDRASHRISPVERLNMLVAADMTAADRLIRKGMASSVELIPDLARHLIESGGKRLRPLLTLAAATAGGYQGDGHIRLAAAVEFIHTATLLHDDVVDESALSIEAIYPDVGVADVTNPPVLNLTNLQNQVTLPPSGNSGFYRLKTP